MHAATVNLIRSATEQLVALAAPENRAAAQAVAAALMGGLQPSGSVGKRGPTPIGATILVGSYGHVVCDDYNEAAAYLGIKPASLNVRLSQGGGQVTFQRQDPDTLGPMEVTVTRGRDGTTNPHAQHILATAPSMTKRKRQSGIKPAVPAPTDGRLINRMRKFNPVENG